MIFKSQILTEASGSLGGVTFFPGQGGLVLRRRFIPTNPNSPLQQTVRGHMNALSNHWINTLTAGQRAAWATYAANVTVTNRLGDPIYISGLNHYIRSNVPRLQAALPRVDNGPTIMDKGEFTNPTAIYDSLNDEIDLSFATADDWVGEDDAAMLISGSAQQNPTVNYFKGPYRYADAVLGDSVTPETSPYAAPMPYPCIVGNRCFLFIRVTRADGRLSMPYRFFCVGE